MVRRRAVAVVGAQPATPQLGNLSTAPANRFFFVLPRASPKLPSQSSRSKQLRDPSFPADESISCVGRFDRVIDEFF
jgi:hypothetical protein